VAAEIRARIAAARILTMEPSVRVRASMGVGVMDNRAKDPDDVLVRADRAIYRDKLARRARSA
jgi:predicted signal transduction protein with EAL and GGDEF domain